MQLYKREVTLQSPRRLKITSSLSNTVRTQNIHEIKEDDTIVALFIDLSDARSLLIAPRMVPLLVDVEHFAEFRQRPERIVDDQFQLISDSSNIVHRRDDFVLIELRVSGEVVFVIVVFALVSE